MSMVWSGADKDLLGKLDRRLQESDIATVSSVSTNATASDLCGPGRTLGLAFRYLGRKLETALSRAFEKRGFGPIPTSERIIQRSEKLRTIGYDSKDGGKIAEKIKRKLHSYLLENDCRRLLKYLQSEVLSNQLLAIDSVVDVSLRNAYARSILHELQVAPVLARVSLMAEREVGATRLAIRSRRALICVEDNYVNAVMRELQLIVLNDTITGTYYVGIPKSFIHPSIYSTPLLEYLLQDGKLSFVVLRFFHDLLTSICTPEHPAGRNSLDELLWNIHGWLPRFLSNLKDDVDWMSLDRVLHFLVSQMYEDAIGEGITMRYCDYQALDLILRKPDGLPHTASYILDNVTGLCAPPFFDFAEKAEEICSVVKELSGIAVDDLSEKIDLRDLLREFPCLVGAWTYMHGAYFPLCALVEMVRNREAGYGLSIAPGPRGKFQALAREVARHQFMNWDEVVQKHVLIVASFNRYCRIVLENAFEEAFADPDITATLSASSTRSMSETWKKRLYERTWNFDFVEIEKHCTTDGSFLHFCQPKHKNPRFCTEDRGSICYKARIPRSHVTGLKMKPGEKFDSTGHYPLLAFTNAKGKRQYITELDSPYYLYYGTIEDGASETQYWDENGVLRRSGRMRFKVLTSRWDPDPTEGVISDPLTWELYDPNEGARLVEIESEKSSIGSQEIYEDTI